MVELEKETYYKGIGPETATLMKKTIELQECRKGIIIRESMVDYKIVPYVNVVK
jgi:hypothetical protein